MADETIRLDVVTVAHNKGLTDAGREMRGLRGEAGRLTGSLGTLEDGSFDLDRAIEETHEEVRRLRQEFAKTGDTTLFGDLRRQQHTLNNLNKIKEAIEEVTEATAELGGAAAQVSGGGAQTGAAFGGRMGPAIITGVIAGLLPHLPTLGAMIAGAVAGTIGTGGVIGGIAMASKDPRVRMAAGTFGEAVANEFFRGGEVFVEPTIRALNELQMAFNDMDLPETFAKMSPHVTTIAKGFGDLGRNIMPGLNKAFDRMGPFAAVAAKGLGDLGGSLGSFMDSVTASEGALQGLDTLFRMLDGSITLLGGGLEVLSDLYGAFVVNLEAAFLGIEALGIATNQPSLRDFGAKWSTQMDQLGKGTSGASEILKTFGGDTQTASGGVQSFGDSVGLAAQATGALRDGLSETHNAFLGFMGAAINTEEAIDNFTKSVKENGRNLDIDTEAGRENVRILQDIANGALEATQRKFDETHSVKDATTVYEGYRKKLYDTAIQLGFTKDMAQALVDKWLGLAALPDITKQVTVKYRVTGKDQLANSFGAGFIEGFADGGRVPGPVGVPRLAVVHGGEYVVSNQMQAGAATPGLNMSGGVTWVAPINLQGSGYLSIDELREVIRSAGGTLAAIGVRN